MERNGNIVTAENDEEVAKFREIHKLLNECAEAAGFDERLDEQTVVIGPGSAQLFLKVVREAIPKLSDVNWKKYGSALRNIAEKDLSFYDVPLMMAKDEDTTKLIAVVLSTLTVSGKSFFQRNKMLIIGGGVLVAAVAIYFLTRKQTVASQSF